MAHSAAAELVTWSANLVADKAAYRTYIELARRETTPQLRSFYFGLCARARRCIRIDLDSIAREVENLTLCPCASALECNCVAPF